MPIGETPKQVNPIPTPPLQHEDIDALLAERQETHGDAWRIANAISAGLPISKVQYAGYLFSFMIILAKVCRLLFTPENKEHWRDIAGYATLVVRKMESEGK